MSLTFGQGVETSGAWSGIGRLNPVAKLGITAIITVGLLLSLDQTTVGIILIAEILMLPFVGLRPRTIALRSSIILTTAVIITLVNALFSGVADGTLYFSWGPFTLSSEGLVQASVVGMRVLALSLPAVLLLSTTDPVLLADGVQQQLKVPARYAMSSVVGLRLLPQLALDWQEMSAARRARGMSSPNPIAAIRSGTARTVGLLVSALRRAVRMAMAMQARGFDPYAPRTAARVSKLRAADWFAMVATLVIVAGASWYSYSIGDWTFSLLWPQL